MEFICRIARDAGLDFGERNRVLFKHYLKAHPGVLLKITPILPESNKQRRFLEGGVIPLDDRFHEAGIEKPASMEPEVCWWIPRLRRAERGATSWQHGGRRLRW
jgi:hypothetical protein